MPPIRRSTIGRRTRNSTYRFNQRRSQSLEQRSQQNQVQQLRNARRHRSADPNPLNPASRQTTRLSRRAVQEMEYAAFAYNSEKVYSEHANIGGMTVRCPHCDAAKFQGETPGMCCANGKVRLPAFESPPDPLHSFIFGTCQTSKHFLAHIQEYNAAFQMTSFGATKIVRDNFMPTFKVITSCGISYEKCDLSSNKINMRVQLHNDQSAVRVDKTNGLIRLPNNFCTILHSTEELIESVFPNIVQNYRNLNWLRERAILAPKNVHVNEINYQIQEKLPGAVTSYKSVDSAMNADDAVNYPIEFLNSLEPPGMPPHCLNLKVGSSIILLRNLNAPKLCNGTRLAVKKLIPKLIETTILTGTAKGEIVLIPRIPLIPTDMPFEFKRLQFPVRLSFAMSINKAQGQTLQICGLNLGEPCFSHGQLYVACSRVGTPNCLFVLASNGQTKNIVYPNVLD